MTQDISTTTQHRSRAAKALPLAAILLIYAAAVALSVNWGLPGPERVKLLFPGGADEATLAEISTRAAAKSAAEADVPIVLQGQRPAAPRWSRAEALDACRRFLLYSDNPDEMMTLSALSRLKPAQGLFDPGIGQYGGAFLYPLGAWLKTASATGLVRQGDLGFYVRHPAEMAALYVAGRLFVALCVAAAIVVIYLIGLRLAGPGAAALAAGLVAFSPAVLAESVVLKPHAAALFPAMLAVFWTLKYFDAPSRRLLLFAALAAGLALGMTTTAAPALLVVLLGVWLVPQARLGRTVLAVALAAGAYLLTNPYSLLSLHDRLAEMDQIRRFYAGPVSALAPLDYLISPLREGFGIPFILAALAGAVLIIFHDRRKAALLLVPIILVLALMPLGLGRWAGDPQMVRFALPVIALLALVIGWAATLLPRLSAATVLAVLAVALALALPTVNAQWQSSHGVSARLEAGRWLNKNAAAGQAVLMDYPPAPYRAPPLDYLHREILYAPDPARAYFAVSTSVGPQTPPPDRACPRRVVFSLGNGSPWFRAPVTFADRSIFIDLCVSAPKP
jgi:hypothetical protein